MTDAQRLRQACAPNKEAAPTAPSGWWMNSGYGQGYGTKGTVSMALIAGLQAWAHRELGATSSALLIERVDGQTRVALRFRLKDAIGECELGVLRALHKARATQPRTRELLREACGCATVA